MNALTAARPGLMRSAAALTYGLLCYLFFLATFLAFVAFAGGFLPHPFAGAFGDATWQAALADLGLVLAFGIQHSCMARPWFKRRLTRVVPEPVERATYVAAASAALGGLIVFWQPIPGEVWRVDSFVGQCVLWAVFAFGWSTVLFTTFLIDHFELFGLRQAWAYATGSQVPAGTFKTPNVYRLVRHPMQLGFVIAFWAVPTMSADRLALAVLLTGYIMTALIFEERDLVTLFGDEYRAYQQRVPRLFPRPWRR